MIRLAALVLAAVASVVVPAYVGLGSSEHWMMAVKFILLFVLPLFVISLTFGYFGHSWRWVHSATLALVLATFAIAGCVVGRELCSREIASAKSSSDSLMHALESFRAEHGAYPDSLSRLSPAQAPSRLLSYLPAGSRFELQIKDPGNRFGGWSYDLFDHQWVEIRD